MKLRLPHKCLSTIFFANFGEGHFRSGEERVIERIINTHKKVVMASGGGAMLSDTTRKLFKENALTIWLNIPTDVLWNRIKNARDRPILKVPNAEEHFKQLYEARKPIYESADIHVKIKNENIIEAMGLITDILNDYHTNNKEASS